MGVVAVTVAIALVVVAVVLLAVAVRIPRRPGGYRPPVATVAPSTPRRRPVREDVRHALYRYPHLLRDGGRYYGISDDPEARHRRHQRDPKDQWWFRTSTGEMQIIAWYPNRTLARAAERTVIQAAHRRGEDIANQHHVPRSTAPRRKTRAARR